MGATAKQIPAIYLLADGDADPNLVYFPFLAQDWHLIFEDSIRKTLAMLNETIFGHSKGAAGDI